MVQVGGLQTNIFFTDTDNITKTETERKNEKKPDLSKIARKN